MLKVYSKRDKRYSSIFEGFYHGKHFIMEVSNWGNEIALEYTLFEGDFTEDESEVLANLLADMT